MQFAIHLESKKLTSGAGTIFPDSSTREFIRGDGEVIEVIFIRGDNYGVTAVELPGDAEIQFTCKRTGDFGGKPSVVDGSGFVFDSVSKIYASRPSFGSAQMAAVFVGADDVEQVTSNATLAAENAGQLVLATSASSIAVTVPTGVFTAGQKIYVMRGGSGAVTLTGGATLTDVSGLAAGLAARQIVQVEFTSSSAATLTVADELTSISLGGEISYRDAGTADSWASVQFDVTVKNERFRGDEGNPLELGDPNNYYTKTESVALFLQSPLDADDIGDGEIETDKLDDGAVTTDKLDDGSVTAAKVATGAIGTTKLEDDAVTAAKIAAGAVGTGEMADGAITTAKVADFSITAAKLDNEARALPLRADITATTYTLALTDANKLASYESASAGVITIPTDSAVAFAVGTQIKLIQSGGGKFSLNDSAAAVSLRLAGQHSGINIISGLRSPGIGGGFNLTKLATNTWLVEPVGTFLGLDVVSSLGNYSSTTTTTLQSYSVNLGRVYHFDFEGIYLSSATTEGIGIAINALNGMSVQGAAIIHTTAAGAVVSREFDSSNYTTPLIGVSGPGPTLPLPFRMWGRFVVNSTNSSNPLFSISVRAETGAANWVSIPSYRLRITSPLG